MGTFRAKRPRRRRARRNGCFRRLLFLKIHLILSVSVFSNNSSLFTIHASKSGSPLFTSTLRAVNRMIRWKRKKAKYPDEKFAKGWKTLAKKLPSVNCLRVFGFYISILLFMSTASSKLNFKHRAWMQSILQGSSGEALLSATDLVYNMRYLRTNFVIQHTRRFSTNLMWNCAISHEDFG